MLIEQEQQRPAQQWSAAESARGFLRIASAATVGAVAAMIAGAGDLAAYCVAAVWAASAVAAGYGVAHLRALWAGRAARKGGGR